MILIIRGHIRESFSTSRLRDFVKKIYIMNPELKIFIHTWSKFSNNISWRNIINYDIPVTEEIIYNYFYEIKNIIKHIIIDDDTNIELIGNTIGNINNGPMPIIGWKNYWYGKYKIIEYIHNNIDTNEMVINTRFDIMNVLPAYIIENKAFIKKNITSKSLFIKPIINNNNAEEIVIDFIKNNIGIKFTKNILLFNAECNGIDNIYVGNIETMYTLIHHFFYDLDNVLIENNNTVNQEKLVYRVNNQLFENSNETPQKSINIFNVVSKSQRKMIYI
jgi:hypothetical protein